MKMKKAIALFVVIISTLLVLASCSSAPIYGSYVRENEGSDLTGVFTITLMKNGKCSYYESMLSSYIGYGEYTIEGNRLIIVDKNIPGLYGKLTHTYVFEYKFGRLIYLAEESDNFMYISLPDGAMFKFDLTK
jgi:hypothetical protein